MLKSNTDNSLQNKFMLLCNFQNLERLDAFIKDHKEQIDIDEGFIWACTYNFPEIVKYLLKEHHANIHANESSAIKNVCTQHFNPLAQYLLKSPELTEHADALTAFLTSYSSGNYELIEFIIFECGKTIREQIEQRIEELGNHHSFQYSIGLINKMKLIDELQKDLFQKPIITKMPKI